METLAALRKIKGLTQIELANAIGVQAQSISKWERGLSNPSPKHLKQLASVLGVSSQDIFLLIFNN